MFFSLCTEYCPVHLALIDEVVTCHPLLHQRVLELFIQLFEAHYESLEILAQLEIKKMLLDRLVNLLSKGFVASSLLKNVKFSFYPSPLSCFPSSRTTTVSSRRWSWRRWWRSCWATSWTRTRSSRWSARPTWTTTGRSASTSSGGSCAPCSRLQCDALGFSDCFGRLGYSDTLLSNPPQCYVKWEALG